MKQYVNVAFVGILLVGSLGYNMYQNHQNRVLLSGLTILNERAETTKKHNLKMIDSLQDISVRLDSLVTQKEVLNTKLQLRIQHYLAKDLEDEKALNNITNVDSIRSLFARYYPYHNSTGKTGY